MFAMRSAQSAEPHRHFTPFKLLSALVVLGSLVLMAVTAPTGAHAAPAAGSLGIVLTPAAGPAASKSIVTGTAFGASTTVSVLWNCASSTCTGATTLTTVNTGLSGGFSATITIPAVATGTYSIGALAGNGSFASANFTVNTAPANDDYGNAVPLFPLPYSNFKAPEDTTAATTASDDPTIANCGAGNGVNGHSVWFSIIESKKATAPTRIIISTGRSNYPTVLAVFSGTRSTLTQLACSANFLGGSSSKVTFLMQPGVSYHVEIMSEGANAGGSLSIAADVDRVKGGVFNANAETFTLASANVAGTSSTTVQYGGPGDIPLVGDWTGQGFDTVAAVNQTQSSQDIWYESNSNSSPLSGTPFAYGLSTDLPVAGDWTGQGFDTIGVYRPSTGTFYLANVNGPSGANFAFTFGPTGVGALPIVGDWTGQGFDTVGLYVPSTGVFYLRNSNTSGPADITINTGLVNGSPVAGDWTAQGKDTIGVYANGTFSLFNSNATGPASVSYAFGAVGDIPVTGHWTGTGGI